MTGRITIAGQSLIQNTPLKTAVMQAFTERPLRRMQIQEIEQHSGLAANEIVTAIEALNVDGLTVGSRMPFEYYYDPRESVLSADCVAAYLNTRWWGKRILVGDELSSTIDIAKALPNEDACHGTVIAANAQTQGRGRQGSAWTSRHGRDLLITFLIRYTDWVPSPSLLSLYAATAVARVLETAYHLQPSIKWPNDLMADGGKLGGVIVESDHRHQTVYVSLGLNVHSRPSDWPSEIRNEAVSLTMLNDSEWKRDRILAQCGTTWETLWESMLSDRGEAVRGYWRRYSNTLGHRARLQYRGSELTGLAKDIDDTGALLFRSDDGETLTLVAEEVQNLRVEE